MIKKTIIFLILTFTTVLISFSVFIFVKGKEPVTLNKYTISNGKQEIVFQGMVHIAEKEFYEKVIKDVKKYKSENYVYLYELVKLKKSLEEYSDKEKDEMKNTIGIPDGYYAFLSEILDVESQKDYMYHIEENDINADLTVDEIIEIYKNHKDYKEGDSISGADIQDIDLSKKYNNFEKTIFKYITRILINYSIENSLSFDESVAKDIIIEKRDQKLFEEVLKIKDKNIIINYGEGHFLGFFKKLKESDDNWKIVKTEKLVAF